MFTVMIVADDRVMLLIRVLIVLIPVTFKYFYFITNMVEVHNTYVHLVTCSADFDKNHTQGHLNCFELSFWR